MLREKIHRTTSLLARRIVAESSGKNISGDKIVQFNSEADNELFALIDPEQIHSILDKLTLLNDEEIRASHPYWRNLSYNALMRLIVITQAQLQHTKKELLDLMEV